MYISVSYLFIHSPQRVFEVAYGMTLRSFPLRFFGSKQSIQGLGLGGHSSPVSKFYVAVIIYLVVTGEHSL